MSNLSVTAKKLIRNIIVLYLLFALAGSVLLSVFDWIPILEYIAGLSMGSLFSILKVLSLERSISQTLDKQPDSANKFMLGQYYIRYALTFAVFIVSALIPGVSMVGAIIGVMLLQPAAYAAKI